MVPSSNLNRAEPGGSTAEQAPAQPSRGGAAAITALQGLSGYRLPRPSWSQAWECSHSLSMTSLGLSPASRQQRGWGAHFPHQPRRTQGGL